MKLILNKNNNNKKNINVRLVLNKYKIARK